MGPALPIAVAHEARSYEIVIMCTMDMLVGVQLVCAHCVCRVGS